MSSRQRITVGLATFAVALSLLSSLTFAARSDAPYMMDKLPGISQVSTPLSQRMADEFNAKKGVYEVRTENLFADGRPRFINRLIFEDSPYLLQHAHNPVNWYAWGGEAFETAERENKPIFLSIGYATCHWCHVMEKESFDNEAVAELLNKYFISIKVDREQRPDVDEVYMTAVQIISGQGGWPMSSFLTPEGKPFYGGTYYPPQNFTAILNRINEVWGTQKETITESADRLVAAIRGETASKGGGVVDASLIKNAVSQILSLQDSQYGGIGGTPKFPHEPKLMLLLDQYARTKDEAILSAVEKNLDAMAHGGIYDQVGGGFHRYSTDARWLVPHFEKMLYNQAQMARVYLLAYQITSKPMYARIARQTLDYVLRDMRGPGGGIYSAGDADSEGEEGVFFIWTPAQLKEHLDEDDANLVIDLYGVSEGGNFEGKNILHLPTSIQSYAADHKIQVPDLLKRLDKARELLRLARDKREKPLVDTKILTGWNGLMITALVQGYVALEDKRYIQAAEDIAQLIWQRQRSKEGQLRRVNLAGNASVAAGLEDYAYYIEALLALYDATATTSWLSMAQQLTDEMISLFWDKEYGGFFMNSTEAEPYLVARPKSAEDNALPSGNSTAVRVLAILAKRLDESKYAEQSRKTVEAFSGGIQNYPAGYAYMLYGANELFNQ